MSSTLPQFSGRFEISDSVSKGTHYETIDKAFRPHTYQIQNKLPKDVLIRAERKREVTGMGDIADVDEVTIFGFEDSDGETLVPVKVRKHIPEPMSEFADRVLECTRGIHDISLDLVEYFNTVARLSYTQLFKVAESVFGKDKTALEKAGIQFNVFLESQGKANETPRLDAAAEAKVTRDIFEGFTETVQLRQMPKESLEGFLSRVKIESEKTGEI